MKTSRVFNSKPTICTPVKKTIHFQIKWLFNILKCFLTYQSVIHSVVSDSAIPMDCRPPGSSVHGISQVRIMEWVVISFSRRKNISKG